MYTVINGYKTAKSVSPTVFSSILKELRDCISKAHEKLYNVLFGEELNRLADMYVLNCTTIPEGVSVWDETVNRLNQRIFSDSRNNLDTRYNFGISIEIMPYKNVWYFLVVSNNDMLAANLLDPIKQLEPYRVLSGEDVITPTDEEAKTWDEIRKEYSGKRIPMRQYYMPDLPCKINEDEIVLESVNARAKVNAENTEFAEVFNMLCKGRQIAPYDIPRYYEDAIKEIDCNSHHRESIRMKYTTLTSILPVLSIEELKNPCGFRKPAQDNASSEPQAKE